MKSWFKWLVLVGVVALVAVGALYGRKLLGGDSAEAQTSQRIAVTRGALVSSIEPTGQVEAVRSAQMTFDVDRVTLVELSIAAGQQVRQGDVLARLDAEPLQLAVDQAEADLLTAQAALDSAQNPYTELEQRKAALSVTQAETALAQAQAALEALLSPDLTQAQAAVAQAEYSLQSAELDLSTTQHSSAVGKAVRDLEYAVAWHQRKLADLRTQQAQGSVTQDAVDEQSATLQDLQADLTLARSSAATTLADAEERVSDARDALETAQQDLAELQAEPAELDVTKARNKVAQAEYNLATASESAALMAAGPDAKDVQLAQARYEAALASLEEARLTLTNAVMVAPFDATVVSIGAEVDDVVSANTVIATLANLTELRVVAAIDETEIAQLQVGMPATITFDSLPGRSFTGDVLEVPYESTVSSSVVTYDVVFGLDGAQDAGLLPGMTANISLETGRREDALLLPILAVQQSDDGNVVTLADGSTARVELGINDGQYVEIVKGLIEGDVILVEYQETTTSTQGGFGQGGGGMIGIGEFVRR